MNAIQEKRRDWQPDAVMLPRRSEVVPGVSQEALSAVEDALRSGRRHFGVAGASIGSSGFEDTRDVALAGEVRTSQHILEWIESRRIGNAVLVDSARIVGFDEDKDTDHVLILGNTVLLIDTKAWQPCSTFKFGARNQVLRADNGGDAGAFMAPDAFSHCHWLSTEKLLGIWRRYLVEQAYVSGVVYLNTASTAVVENRAWFEAPYRLLSRRTLFPVLDRILELQRMAHLMAGTSPALNSEIVAQAVVAAVRGERRELVEECASDSGAGPLEECLVHFDRRSLELEECRCMFSCRTRVSRERGTELVHLHGERMFGLSGNYWLEKNEHEGPGADGTRGKVQFHDVEDLRLVLGAGLIGEQRFKKILWAMRHREWDPVPSEELDRGDQIVVLRERWLTRQYSERDCLSPDPTSSRAQYPSWTVSSLVLDWDEEISEITALSREALIDAGVGMKKYQDQRERVAA